MKIQRLAAALTVANLVLLLLTVTQAGSISRDVVTPTLRTQVVELVDDSGQIRSRLEVKAGGEVALQLFDQKGIIKVKLGAGESGSGMFLADETTQSGVQIIASQNGTAEMTKTTGITMTSKNGQQRVITPCRLTKRCTRRS